MSGWTVRDAVVCRAKREDSGGVKERNGDGGTMAICTTTTMMTVMINGRR